ncbi:glycosyltransferase family 2 protein [Sphingobacterium multivorum]|uniref:glycosyltransferase family 2 protein n=1 Tax=Sphingobacterium multivorum TaxID=28454 RepID=UPI003019926C
MMTTSNFPNVSLIISTYNWPKALEKCLKSILTQTYLPTEIIIADDGSSIETEKLIEHFTQNCAVRLKHIWHDDKGFRLAAIRNKAIFSASGDYIIQIDGDIIMERHFIEDHLRFQQEGAFLCGSRVWIPKEYSDQLLNSKDLSALNVLQFPISSILNGLRIPMLGRFITSSYKKNKPLALRGCNMSFWKKDLMEINGYNEDIQGWGSEDADLAIRLMNSGIRKLFIKFAGIAYHIYHKENSRASLKENEKILSDSISLKKTRIINGIIKDKSDKT